MRKILILIMISVLTFTFAACSQKYGLNDSLNEEKAETVDFERISPEQLPEKILQQIEIYKKEKGYKVFKVDNDEKVYITVFAGEKRTGGYSVEVSKIEMKDEIVKIYALERSPDPDSLTIQVITYPFDVVRIDEDIPDNIEVDFSQEISEKDSENKTLPSEPETSSGKFVGLIDNHTVEIEVNEEIKAFQLSENAKQILNNSLPEPNTKVTIESCVDKKGQLILINIKW